MGRIRTVKPELFDHEGLYELEEDTGLPIRIAFIGLFTQCDREGRFKWRPVRLKIRILPYDEVDFLRVLDALATRGFVVRYASNGVEYGHIPTWRDHQSINNRETESEIPEPPEIIGEVDASPTREPRVTDLHKGKGREGKGRERKESCAKSFKEFWEAFDDKRGKEPALRAWKAIRGYDAALHVEIIAGARRYAAARPGILDGGTTPKMAQGWLTDRRWEDAEAPQKTSHELPEFKPRKQA